MALESAFPHTMPFCIWILLTKMMYVQDMTSEGIVTHIQRQVVAGQWPPLSGRYNYTVLFYVVWVHAMYCSSY